MIYVVPAKRPDHLKGGPGDPDYLIVRDPLSGQIMPQAGRYVPENDIYWSQRLAQGDVELAEPPAPPDTDPAMKA